MKINGKLPPRLHPHGLVVRFSVLASLLLLSLTSSVTVAKMADAAGLKWNTSVIPVSHPIIQGGLKCFGSSCFASALTKNLDSEILLYSSDGGISWSTAIVPTGDEVATPYDCFQGNCVSMATSNDGSDQSVTYSSDGGISWKTALDIGSNFDYFQMQCSTNHCLLYVDPKTKSPFSMYSANTGETWKSATLSGSTQPVGGLVCNVNHCLIAASSANSHDGPTAIQTSSNGGASWFPAKLPSIVEAVSFPVCIKSHCVDVAASHAAVSASTGGSNIIYSVNSGVSWSTSKLPSKYFKNLFAPSCDVVTCTTVGSITKSVNVNAASTGNTELYSRNMGANWSIATFKKSLGPVEAPACFNTICIALAKSKYSQNLGGSISSRLLFSSDGGADWRTAKTEHEIRFTVPPVCVVKNCIQPGTLNGSDVILFSDDGGASWINLPLPLGIVRTDDAPTCALENCIVAASTIHKRNGDYYNRILYVDLNSLQGPS